MNIRDTNLRNYIPWDSVHIDPPSTQTIFSSGIYIIENDFSTSSVSVDSLNGRINKNTIKLVKIDPFVGDDTFKWQKTQLRLDDK